MFKSDNWYFCEYEVTAINNLYIKTVYTESLSFLECNIFIQIDLIDKNHNETKMIIILIIMTSII